MYLELLSVFSSFCVFRLYGFYFFRSSQFFYFILFLFYLWLYKELFIFKLSQVNLKTLIGRRNIRKFSIFLFCLFIKHFSVVFINHNMCPLCKLLDLFFCTIFDLFEFFNFLLEFFLFLQQFEFSCLKIINFLYHCLCFIVNILILLSLVINLRFFFKIKKYVFNRAYFSYHLHIIYLTFMST